MQDAPQGHGLRGILSDDSPFLRCLGAFGLVACGAASAEAQLACEAMTGFSAPDVRITAAAPVATPVALCKVDGVIGREIHFSLWLPTTWNGKFVMGGQGGYAGRVDSQALGMGALEKGYAVAGTDTGHVGPAGSTDGSWALGNMERVVNYGHAAIHRVTPPPRPWCRRATAAPPTSRISPAARTADARR